jgi:methionyl-tRNA formyltransferase
LRIAFLGTDRFAVPSLEALAAAGHDVTGVITQPDREKGRGRALAPPPVKAAAERLGLRVLQPPRIRAPEALADLAALGPDLLVVVAYGQILPPAVLRVAPRGAINVHASLLPRYRGAAPIQWAIVSGEAETGVTTMLLDEGLDTGPTLLARPLPIAPDDTAASLSERLAGVGAELLLATLDGLLAGNVRPQPQDAARATHARLIRKEDGRVDWSLSAEALERRVRGFHPWPGAFFLREGRPVKLLRARAEALPAAEPGTIAAVGQEGALVACGGASGLWLLEVQPESRRPMRGAAFAAGQRLRSGQRLD